MRGMLIVALLAFMLALVGLTGCNGGDDNEVSTATIAGVVENQITSEPQEDADVALRLNGVTVATDTTAAFGAFAFENIPPEADYTLQVTSPNFIRTFYGPIDVTEADRTDIEVNVLTAAQLFDLEGIEPPTGNTATILAYGIEPDGTMVPVTITANDQGPSDVDSPSQLDVAAGTYTITVTNTLNGESVVFDDVTFAAGSLTIFRALVPGGLPG